MQKNNFRSEKFYGPNKILGCKQSFIPKYYYLSSKYFALNNFSLLDELKLDWHYYCQAQFQSSPSSVQLELSTALILIISTHPDQTTHPPIPGIVVMRPL